MLRQKLQDDALFALKSGDKDKLSLLRFIIAQIQNKEIEKKDKLNNEETVAVIKKVARELKESIDAFEKGGRSELVEANKKQLEIVASYLPAEITDEELNAEIEKILAENKNTVKKNPKAAIGMVMGRLKAKADPSRIMSALKARLKF